jgi:hypothetical protein
MHGTHAAPTSAPTCHARYPCMWYPWGRPVRATSPAQTTPMVRMGILGGTIVLGGSHAGHLINRGRIKA